MRKPNSLSALAKVEAKAKREKLEQEFWFQLHTAIGAGLFPASGECVREWQFDPTRKWRFDFAWPSYKVSVEIEGGAGTGGRHTRFIGFEKDAEKYNEAGLQGWLVGRFTAAMLRRGDALTWLKKAVHSRSTRKVCQ